MLYVCTLEILEKIASDDMEDFKKRIIREGGSRERHVFITDMSDAALKISMHQASFCSKQQCQNVVEELFGHLKSKIRIANVSEVTAAQFRSSLEKAKSLGLLTEKVSDLFQEMKIADLDNRYFQINESLCSESMLTKEDALRQAEQILADKLLLDELGRIYACDKPEHFILHPVHYKIFCDNLTEAKKIQQLICNCLYSTCRLVSRRTVVVDQFAEGFYDEEDFDRLLDSLDGGAMVLYFQNTEEAQTTYASTYMDTVRYLAEKIVAKKDKILWFFIIDVKNPGFSKLLFQELKRRIKTVEIQEGIGNRVKAKRYLRACIKESPYQNLLDIRQLEKSLDDRDYTISELQKLFQEYEVGAIKKKLYLPYETMEALPEVAEQKISPAREQLAQLVGLQEVKKLIDQIIAYHVVHKERERHFEQLPSDAPSRHMVFTGNPGTAKTTVARLLADILKENKILRYGTIVECGRAELVGKYTGWTAKLVQEKFIEARGGILFIDEAYSLLEEQNSFGHEAVNTIVQEMENNRDEVIVIFAGYPKPMKQFLESNAGLRSRIAFQLEFLDYTTEELTEITTRMAKRQGYRLEPGCIGILQKNYQEAVKTKDFGNGRYARNILERAVMQQSERIYKSTGGYGKEELFLLKKEDFGCAGELQTEKTRVIGFAKNGVIDVA